MIRFDSSHPSGADGWSMPPTRPSLYLASTTTETALLSEDLTPLRHFSSPLEGLAFLQTHLRTLPPTTSPVPPARWAGFLSYELARLFEHLPPPPPAPAPTRTPSPPLPFYAFALCHPQPQTPAPVIPVIPSLPHCLIASLPSPHSSSLPRPAFESAVARAIEYIRAGDIFQVNLAQQLTIPSPPPADDIYARLLARTPAWYGAHLDFPPLLSCPAFSLLSNSPELFLHVTPTGQVTTRPIKGTRPRLPGMDVQLLQSLKDQAELHMIVDLLRNDLGRVCTIGSVRVPEPRIIEAHPTVYHGVSTITGRLRPGTTFVDLLRATFPCGSITGAPKIRAMQIIDELEPAPRNAYCGAIGYLSQPGQLQFNVAIRTLTLHPSPAPLLPCSPALPPTATLGIGGGIVADSTPQDEYEETLTKAQALLAAM